ncbi:hypothetical protein DKX38_001178 [Salix brachista]|uniref:ATP-dependent Clp protease proteolytic subunit n=1 Tax=Salix brachista TaxID=2182728 RepID=A0A5N5P2I5_9ROSI|nr:hypothetical protein DKX38_001178 [Salix brachista]
MGFSWMELIAAASGSWLLKWRAWRISKSDKSGPMTDRTLFTLSSLSSNEDYRINKEIIGLAEMKSLAVFFHMFFTTVNLFLAGARSNTTAAVSTVVLQRRVLGSTTAASRTTSPNRTLTTSSPPSSPRASLSTCFLSPFVGRSITGDFSGSKSDPNVSIQLQFRVPKAKEALLLWTCYEWNLWDGRSLKLLGVALCLQGHGRTEGSSTVFKNHFFWWNWFLVCYEWNLVVCRVFKLVEPVPGLFERQKRGRNRDDSFWQCIYHCQLQSLLADSASKDWFNSDESDMNVKPPIFTLCVGNAWGEAALLLAAGSRVNRSAIPSSTIMIKQSLEFRIKNFCTFSINIKPIGRFQGQATDVELASKEIKNVKAELVNLLAKHIGKLPEEIEADTSRPKYFSPNEAVEYGIIDKVIWYYTMKEVLKTVELFLILKRHNLVDLLWNSQLVIIRSNWAINLLAGIFALCVNCQVMSVNHRADTCYFKETLAGGSEIELMKDSGSSSSFDSKCDPSTSFDSSSASGCSSLSGFPVLGGLRLKAIWVLVRISQDKEVIHCKYTTGKSFERLVKSLDRFKWTPRASVGDESVKCDERLLKTVDAIPAKSKRAKLLDTNPGLGSSRSSLVSETERRRENFGYSVEKLGSDGGGGSDRCLKSPQNEQVGEMVIEVNSSARECSGESSAKRELEFFTEVIESELEGNDATLRFANDGVDEREANGFRNTREGHYARKSMDDLERLAMLVLVLEQGRRSMILFCLMTCMGLQITLLDVLEILQRKSSMDNNFMVHPRWEKLHEPYGRRYRRASSYVKRYIDQCLYAAKADGALMCPISVSIAFQQELLLPCQFMRMSV